MPYKRDGTRFVSKLLLTFTCGLLFMLMLSGLAAAEQGKPFSGLEGTPGLVMLISAEKPIEQGLQSFLDRAFKEAEEAKADAVILEINTLGGRLDAAIDIGERIRESKVPVIAYVTGKALSAGSYIALNADAIVMEPGSSLGAAAIVTADGTRVTDSKTISAWRAEMRAAAELNGRNGAYAEAMVDDRRATVVKELDRTYEQGELITFSAQDALAAGYAERVEPNREGVLAWLGADDRTVVETLKPSMLETIAGFLTQSWLAGLLLLVGFVGIGIEMLLPGFGIAGIVGLISFGAYFGGHMVAGFAGMEHIALFIVGVILLVSEIFIPSFGILGALGTLSLGSGVVLAAYDTSNALATLGLSLLASLVVVILVAKRFKHRGVWHRFILKDELSTENGYVTAVSHDDLIGEIGTALTPLRPAGTAVFGNRRVDVVTEGGFILQGTKIVVVSVEGARIVVTERKET